MNPQGHYYSCPTCGYETDSHTEILDHNSCVCKFRWPGSEGCVENEGHTCKRQPNHPWRCICRCGASTRPEEA